MRDGSRQGVTDFYVDEQGKLLFAERTRVAGVTVFKRIGVRGTIEVYEQQPAGTPAPSQAPPPSYGDYE